jgi:hypothetical protein
VAVFFYAGSFFAPVRGKEARESKDERKERWKKKKGKNLTCIPSRGDRQRHHHGRRRLDRGGQAREGRDREPCKRVQA